MNNQENMTPKEENRAPMTESKEMEITELFKEFKIILLKQLSEKKKKTTCRKLHEINKAVHKQNQKFNKVIETNKNLKLKTTITYLKKKNH